MGYETRYQSGPNYGMGGYRDPLSNGPRFGLPQMPGFGAAFAGGPMNQSRGPFGGAVDTVGKGFGAAFGGLKDAGQWLIDPDNADTINAITNAVGTGANLVGAFQADRRWRDERDYVRERDQEQREDEERDRKSRASYSPIVMAMLQRRAAARSGR